jgi:NADPH:quinone reductase-like Zn-dependent oxidoreductase
MVLGVDGAGVVMAVGSRVRRFKIGDRVYSYNPESSFYAEYVVVPADKVARVPGRLDLEHAGAIATTELTALQGIDDHLRVRRGEVVIVHGGSGGVGTLLFNSPSSALRKFWRQRLGSTDRNWCVRRAPICVARAQLHWQ